MLTLLLIIGSFGREPSPNYDMVEINHFCPGDDGKIQFVQIILWDYSPNFKRFDCQFWQIIKQPYYVDKQPGRYRVIWRGKKGERLTITAAHYRESFTKHDPERENAKLYAAEFRKELPISKATQARVADGMPQVRR